MFGSKYKQVIKVGGMHCEHCSQKVKEALLKNEKVQQVGVSLQEQQATIRSDEEIDFPLLKEAIEVAGFSIIE